MVEGPNDFSNPLITEEIEPFYVYLLVDPADGEIFYVGKGTSWRFADHLEEQAVGDDMGSPDEQRAKQKRIAAIRARGDEPQVEFARRQIEDPAQAYLVEATLIDVLRHHGAPNLSNEVRGHGADLGLISLDEVREKVATPLLETDMKAILIKLSWWTMSADDELPRLGYGFKRGMIEKALYDSTRAWWRLSVPSAKTYPYAVAVFQGVTRGIWKIDHARWRTYEGRAAFEGESVPPTSEAAQAFVGDRGKRVPARRADGRAVFGSGQPLAYWP